MEDGCWSYRLNLYSKKEVVHMEFIKINEQLFIKKLSDELYLIKEYNAKKGCYYIASYTEDEIFIYFNINKKELENYSSSS